MSFDWNEYLVLARELAGSAGEPRMRAGREARLRAALSRAYYAAFCLTRNHLRDIEGHRNPGGPQAHAYVSTTLQNSADLIRIGIDFDLERLRRQRNLVDYRDDVHWLQPLVFSGLIVAQRIAATLPTL